MTWDSSVVGTCIPPSHLKFAAYFNSSVAVLTDVAFALLPLPILWNVKMNWKVKSAVAGILSLGIFAAVAAIVKITFLGAYGQHGDFLWDSADLTIWYASRLTKLICSPRTNHGAPPCRTTVEINVAIIAASFPCLKPLFKTLFDGTSAAARYGSSKYKGYIRNGDTNRTPKSGLATGPRSQAASEFEMYNTNNKFTTDVKTGTPSITGSEESILPQDTKPSTEQRTDGGITKTSTVFVSYDKRDTRTVGWEDDAERRN